jgi:multidrug efflux system membrane fusion protein
VGIRAETRGRVAAIGAERGERVEAGDVLLRLDERDRREVLAEARALVKQREMEYAGRKQLRGNGYVSETQLAEAEAAVAQARAELRRAELDLDYMVVEAPFAGTILERDVEVGDFVEPGDPLLTFVDNTTLIVTASVAEQDVGAIEPGQRASAKLITGQNVTGRLRYVSPVADPATRTFTLEMELPNPDGRLPSGVTAELSLPVGEVMAQRVSPALLTLDDDGKLGLKVVDENGNARFVPTEIVKTAPNGVWLTGLPSDATIITVGQGFVRDGEPVEAIVEGRGTMRAEAGE